MNNTNNTQSLERKLEKALEDNQELQAKVERLEDQAQMLGDLLNGITPHWLASLSNT